MKPLILAWGILTHNPGRLLAAICALLFSILLMLIQLGFYNTVFDSATEFYRQLKADVYVIRKDKDTIIQSAAFERTRAHQALAVPGVATASPLTIRREALKNLEDGYFRPIRVITIRPEDRIFRSPALNEETQKLLQSGTALIDTRSRKYFGPLEPGPAQLERWAFEIVGTFELGTAFDADGNLLMSESTYAQAIGKPIGRIEMVVLTLEPGAQVAEVVGALRAALPDDVLVFDREAMIAHELRYWSRTTPIAPVFGVGLLLGFLVGIVICYQILYTDVCDHWTEFAILRAMGYGDGFLKLVVLSEALLLPLLAALPAVFLGFAVYEFMEGVTGLMLRLTLERALLVIGLSVMMCIVASLFALRRVVQVDPAELF